MPDVAVMDAPMDRMGIEAGMLDADAGVCGGQFKSPFTYGKPLHAWNFDEGASPIADSIGMQTMLVPGYTFAPGAKDCNSALMFDAPSQAVTQQQAGIGVTVSMLVQIPSGQSGLPILLGTGAMFGAWYIDFVDNQNGTVSAQITIQHTMDQSVASSLKIPIDGAFHLLEISVAGTTAGFSVDGSSVETKNFQTTIADTQNLYFGTDSKIVIDELRIFKNASW